MVVCHELEQDKFIDSISFYPPCHCNPSTSKRPKLPSITSFHFDFRGTTYNENSLPHSDNQCQRCGPSQEIQWVAGIILKVRHYSPPARKASSWIRPADPPSKSRSLRDPPPHAETMLHELLMNSWAAYRTIRGVVTPCQLVGVRNPP